MISIRFTLLSALVLMTILVCGCERTGRCDQSAFEVQGEKGDGNVTVYVMNDSRDIKFYYIDVLLNDEVVISGHVDSLEYEYCRPFVLSLPRGDNVMRVRSPGWGFIDQSASFIVGEKPLHILISFKFDIPAEVEKPIQKPRFEIVIQDKEPRSL